MAANNQNKEQKEVKKKCAGGDCREIIAEHSVLPTKECVNEWRQQSAGTKRSLDTEQGCEHCIRVGQKTAALCCANIKSEH